MAAERGSAIRFFLALGCYRLVSFDRVVTARAADRPTQELRLILHHVGALTPTGGGRLADGSLASFDHRLRLFGRDRQARGDVGDSVGLLLGAVLRPLRPRLRPVLALRALGAILTLGTVRTVDTLAAVMAFAAISAVASVATIEAAVAEAGIVAAAVVALFAAIILAAMLLAPVVM